MNEFGKNQEADYIDNIINSRGKIGTVKIALDNNLYCSVPGNIGDAYVFGDNEWVNIGQVRGEQGEQGLQGLQGEVGPSGPTGPTGPLGSTGIQGNTGDLGPRGLMGELGLQGVQGIQGVKGDPSFVPGPQGIIGLRGATGISAYDVAVKDGFTGSIGAWMLSMKGTHGDRGAAGPKGERGLLGKHGPAGETGKTGTKGRDGTDGKDGSDGKDSTIAGPQGANGPDGRIGERGVTGPIGLTGKRGPKGEEGKIGKVGPEGKQSIISGPCGKKGDRGNTGSVGPKGDTGERGKVGREGKQGIAGVEAEGFLRARFAGITFDFAGVTPPKGSLICDGRALEIEDYKLLYAAIGTTWNKFAKSTLRTQFRLPPSEIDGFALYTRAGKAGEYQKDSFKGHKHDVEIIEDGQHGHVEQGQVKVSEGTSATARTSAFDGWSEQVEENAIMRSGIHKHETKESDGGGSNETRPHTITMLRCIWTGK